MGAVLSLESRISLTELPLLLESFGVSTFEQEWRKRFERFARHYEADHLISGWSDRGLQRRLTIFNELLKRHKPPTSARILDLGCGGGSYVRLLADLGHRVVGLDYSLPSLHRALAADPKRVGHYMAGDAYQLAFVDGCFDVVISIGVFQALSHPERALEEMVRVLKPKGLLVVEFLNALEPVAVLKRGAERLTGSQPRVRIYSPFQMYRWLEGSGVGVVRRVGIYLPPRRYPWLGRVFEKKGVVAFIEDIPALSLATAHAFFIVGEKKMRCAL